MQKFSCTEKCGDYTAILKGIFDSLLFLKETFLRARTVIYERADIEKSVIYFIDGEVI